MISVFWIIFRTMCAASMGALSELLQFCLLLVLVFVGLLALLALLVVACCLLAVLVLVVCWMFPRLIIFCIHCSVQGAYGVVTMPFSVREGINIFLDGFVPTENLRFRETSLSFKVCCVGWGLVLIIVISGIYWIARIIQRANIEICCCRCLRRPMRVR